MTDRVASRDFGPDLAHKSHKTWEWRPYLAHTTRNKASSDNVVTSHAGIVSIAANANGKCQHWDGEKK